MKTKLATFFLLSFLILPTTVSAAWWNPLSWFGTFDTKPIIETQVSNQDSDIEQTSIKNETDRFEVSEVGMTPTNADVHAASNTDDETEINALRQEIQILRSTVQSSQTTNTPSGNRLVATNEQILNTLNKLEQRVGVLEGKSQNNDYSKLLARIESLEKKPGIQTEDYSVIIGEIIKRVNILLNAGWSGGSVRGGYLLCDMYEDKSGMSGTRCNERYKELTY